MNDWTLNHCVVNTHEMLTKCLHLFIIKSDSDIVQKYFSFTFLYYHLISSVQTGFIL